LFLLTGSLSFEKRVLIYYVFSDLGLLLPADSDKLADTL